MHREAARQSYIASLNHIESSVVPEGPRGAALGTRRGSLRLTGLLNRAACSVKLNQWSDAIADCTEALVLDPNSLKALYRRACAYTLAGDFARARTDAERAQQIDPRSEEVNKLLTTLREKSGNK